MSGAHRNDDPPATVETDGAGPAEGERDSVRGWQHLTIAEQLCGAVAFVAVVVAVQASEPSWPLRAIGPIAAGVYAVVARTYANARGPWHGPRFITSRRSARTGARWWVRFAAWWRAPGRRGLLVASAGLFVAAAGFSTAASDTALLSDLRVHGVSRAAVVTDVSTTQGKRRTYLDAVSVRFRDPQGRATVQDLQIIDTVPDSIAVGDHVTVVFDARDPRQVLLASAMDGGHVTTDRIAAGLGIAATILGIGWWWLMRSRRRTPRDAQPTT